MGRSIEGIKKEEEEKNREYRELRRRFGRSGGRRTRGRLGSGEKNKRINTNRQE